MISEIPTPTEIALPPMDYGIRLAAEEVGELADRLESVLDRQHHCLLHRLRLAAETLGAMRAVCGLGYPR